jgi:hypothetical protein
LFESKLVLKDTLEVADMTASADGQDLKLDVTTKKRGLQFLFLFIKNTAKPKTKSFHLPSPFLRREGR